MTQTDVALLEWLDDLKGSGPLDMATPKQIHLTLEDAPTYSHLNRRLRALYDAGLVEKPHDGNYRITELGQRYLHDPDASVEEFLQEEEDDEDEDDSTDS
jgi:DNA-binding transcriptional ArsR family regulator